MGSLQETQDDLQRNNQSEAFIVNEYGEKVYRHMIAKAGDDSYFPEREEEEDDIDQTYEVHNISHRTTRLLETRCRDGCVLHYNTHIFSVGNSKVSLGTQLTTAPHA